MPIKKVNILNVIPSYDINGGIQNYVYGLISELDRNKFNLDVVAFSWRTKNSELEKLFKYQGIGTYTLVNPNKNLIKFNKEVKQLLNSKHYDIIHVHPLGVAFFFLWHAKKAKIKTRIFHAHETKLSDKITHRLRNKPLIVINRNIATNFIADSKDAGKAIFKNKFFDVVHPYINNKKVIFNSNNREQIRRQLNIDDTTFVIGAAGRFSKQKNFEFAIKVFKLFHSKNKKSKLVIWGSGELKLKYDRLIENLNLKNSVLFPGTTDKLYKCYSACDTFVFPSRYEGLGIVAVEAQLNGLYTLASDKIPKDCNIGLCKFLPLELSQWNEALEEIFIENKRGDNFDKNAFNIKESTRKIEELYLSFAESIKEENIV